MEIHIAQPHDSAVLAAIIRRANAPVARRFGLTRKTAPKHPSNCTAAWIRADVYRGVVYFVAMEGADPLGCIGFERAPGGVCYMERLAVSPSHQHRGIGAALVARFMAHAAQEGMTAVSIGVIAEHEELRRWYENRGFTLTETKVYDHLPFTVAFMRRPLGDD